MTHEPKVKRLSLSEFIAEGLGLQLLPFQKRWVELMEHGPVTVTYPGMDCRVSIYFPRMNGRSTLRNVITSLTGCVRCSGAGAPHGNLYCTNCVAEAELHQVTGYPLSAEGA